MGLEELMAEWWLSKVLGSSNQAEGGASAQTLRQDQIEGLCGWYLNVEQWLKSVK